MLENLGLAHADVRSGDTLGPKPGQRFANRPFDSASRPTPRRLDRWTASARHQRNHQENDRDHKEHVRNPTRLTRDPAEAQKFCDDGDHQKNDGVP